MSSVGHRTMMFHGTWGYIHRPSQDLLATLDSSQLNLETYLNSIKNVGTMSIEPEMLMQTPEEADHYSLVWKSQIAQVLNKYIAVPDNREGAIALNPPPIEEISCQPPEIHMLKLMDESYNSAEGIGQVLEAIRRQSGLTPEDFFTRLQPMDADLGTCQNFNSLCDVRFPSSYPQDRMSNIVFQLGAAHTLWCWNPALSRSVRLFFCSAPRTPAVKGSVRALDQT